MPWGSRRTARSAVSAADGDEVEVGLLHRRRSRGSTSGLAPPGKFTDLCRAHVRRTGLSPVSEADLHIVDWNALGREAAWEYGLAAFFIAFVFASGLRVELALPLYCSFLALAATLGQAAVRVPGWWTGCALCVFAAVGVCVSCVCGLSVFLQGWLRFGVVPMAFCVIGLYFKNHQNQVEPPLRRTAICEVVTGYKYVEIGCRSELAALLKALVDLERSGLLEDASADWSLFGRCLPWMRRQPALGPMVDTVLLESDGDGMRYPLVLGEEEIKPARYTLLSLELHEASGRRGEMLDLSKVREVLEKQVRVSDRELNDWADPRKASAPSPQGHINDINGWVRKAAEELHAGDDAKVVACLEDHQPRMRYWLFSAMNSLTCWTAYLYPMLRVFMQIDALYSKACFSEGGSTEGCSNIGKREEACESRMSYFNATAAAYQVSFLELIVVMVMVVLNVGIHSHKVVSRKHASLEHAYFRQACDAQELHMVDSFKRAIEHIGQFEFLFYRAHATFWAWLGANPDLSVRRLMPGGRKCAGGLEGEANACFSAVMQPVAHLRSSIQTDTMGHDLVPADDSGLGRLPQTMGEAFSSLVDKHDLDELKGNRDFQVAFELRLHSDAAWEKFSDFCKGVEYTQQLQYIFGHSGAQDEGRSCHLAVGTRLDGIQLPGGFSLSYIYVQSMPDDGMPYMVRVGYSDLDAKKASESFWRDCEKLKRKMDTVCKRDGSVGEYRQPIVARFALSEQYFERMGADADDSIQKGEGRAGKEHMTEFVERMLLDLPFESRGGSDISTSISVTMAEKEPFGAFVKAARSLAAAVSVNVVCASIVLILPLLRYINRREFFPKGFEVAIGFNTLCMWVLLVDFVRCFSTVERRLSLISKCMDVMHTQTQSRFSDMRLSDEDWAARAEAPTPFGLSFAEYDAKCFAARQRETPEQVEKKKRARVEKWYEKRRLVRDWHSTAASLRVFVSSSRLEAQTMLVAAAAMFLLCLIVALTDTISGTGVLSIAYAFLPGRLKAVQHLKAARRARFVGHAALRHLQEAVAESMAAIGGERALSPLAPHSEVRHVDVASAASDLHERLAPVQQHLPHVLVNQTKSLQLAFRDLENDALHPALVTSTTAVFALSIIVVILVYSILLMWSIVKVNWFFDWHEDLLHHHTESHSMFLHKCRDLEGAAMLESHGDGHGEQPEEESARKSYEKLLGTAVASARKTRERFLLRLFGFVITAQALSTWAAVGAAPLVTRAREVLPGLAVAACEWFAHSNVIDDVQKRVPGDPLQASLNSSAEALNVSAVWHDVVCRPMRHLLRKELNATLVAATERDFEKLSRVVSRHVTGGAPSTARTRRLSASLPELLHGEPGDFGDLGLEASLREWWRAHPDIQPDTRYGIARRELLALLRSGHRLLVDAPTDVAWAMPTPPHAAAELATALQRARGHLQGALVAMGHAGTTAELDAVAQEDADTLEDLRYD